jgi:hypothetical protein
MKWTLYWKCYFFPLRQCCIYNVGNPLVESSGFLHRSDRLIRGSWVNFTVYNAVKMPRIVAFVLCHLGSACRKLERLNRYIELNWAKTRHQGLKKIAEVTAFKSCLLFWLNDWSLNSSKRANILFIVSSCIVKSKP